MPSDARRLHGFTVVSRALRLARQLLLPALLGGASAGDDLPEVLRWIFLILAVPSLLAAVAQWLAFRYRLERDELVIDSGVLSRRRRVIPLARVQNIDLEQGPLERLAGVAELRLETASGGRDTEARLAVLELAEAQALQAELLRRRAAAQHELAAGDRAPADEPAAEPAAEGAPRRELLRLRPSDLAIAGATANEAGIIAAGLATLLQAVDELGALDRFGGVLESVFQEGVAMGAAGAVLAGAILAAAFFILGWVVSILAHLVRFHGFTLSRSGDELRREYGLVSRHRSTLPLERVQAVRIEESLLRRPLGLAVLKIETAGAARQQSRQQGGSATQAEAFVPIARRRDVGRLLAEVFEDARFDGVRFNAVAPVSRLRGFRRLAIPLVLAAAVTGLFLDPAGWSLLLLMPLAWWFARAQYRARAWARTPGYSLARGGVFNRITWVVPERKIQTLHLRESPFQRRHGIGTILIDTAAGGRTARVMDVERRTGLELLASLARDGEAARRASLSSSRAG